MPKSRTEGFTDELAVSDPGSAWRTFLDQYAGKIMGIVRQYERAPGRSHECFLYVCEKLSEQGFRRLRLYDRTRGAAFGTWLTAVVSRLCIDWRRVEYGRRRLPAAVLRLSRFDREVFRLRYMQHLELGPCLQFVRTEFPDTTSSDLSQSLERLHQALSPRTRWSLLQRNLPRSAMSGSQRHTGRPGDERAEDVPPPEDLLAEDQERELLRKALARLTPEQQLMLRLRYQEDMPLQDIARVTGCGDLHRARRLIIAALDELAGWVQQR